MDRAQQLVVAAQSALFRIAAAVEVGAAMGSEQLAVERGHAQHAGGLIVAQDQKGLLEPFPQIGFRIVTDIPFGARAQLCGAVMFGEDGAALGVV